MSALARPHHRGKIIKVELKQDHVSRNHTPRARGTLKRIIYCTTRAGSVNTHGLFGGTGIYDRIERTSVPWPCRHRQSATVADAREREGAPGAVFARSRTPPSPEPLEPSGAPAARHAPAAGERFGQRARFGRGVGSYASTTRVGRVRGVKWGAATDIV